MSALTRKTSANGYGSGGSGNGRVQSPARIHRSSSSTSVLDTSIEGLYDRERHPPSAFLEVAKRNWTPTPRRTAPVPSSASTSTSSISKHDQQIFCWTEAYRTNRNTNDAKRSTSEPIPPKRRDFSPPSQLTLFPPPLPVAHSTRGDIRTAADNRHFKPHRRGKSKGDKEHQPQERKKEKENRPPERYAPVIADDDDCDEEDEDELDDIMIEYQPRGRTLLRIRKKLTERTIISTPRYSPSPNSQSRSPSIRKSSVSPPLTRSSSFSYLSFTAPSPLPSPSEEDLASSERHHRHLAVGVSRLSIPLPLPPGIKAPIQAGIASMDQKPPGGRYYNGNSGRNSSIRRQSYTGSSPRYRTTFSRPPSPHPSSSPTGTALSFNHRSTFTRSSSSPSLLLSYPASAPPGLGGQFPSPRRFSFRQVSPSPSTASSAQTFPLNRRGSTSRSTVRFSDTSVPRPRSNA